MVRLIQLRKTNNRNPIITFTGSRNSLQALPLSAVLVSLFQSFSELLQDKKKKSLQQVFHSKPVMCRTIDLYNGQYAIPHRGDFRKLCPINEQKKYMTDR